MRGIPVDSSGFLALADPDEPSHTAVASSFESLLAEKTSFLTTNVIFDETYTLILTRLGRRQAVDWGESVRRSGNVTVMRVDEDHEESAWAIPLGFKDKDFSYTDATTFAVAAAFEIDEALSVDSHFQQHGKLRVLPGAQA